MASLGLDETDMETPTLQDLLRKQADIDKQQADIDKQKADIVKQIVEAKRKAQAPQPYQRIFTNQRRVPLIDAQEQDLTRHTKEFYPSQIKAMEEVLSNLEQGIKRNVLVAPMQAGKTMTYRLIACEALRRRLCSNFVFMSGVPFISLREQAQDTEEINLFIDMYHTFLTKCEKVTEEYAYRIVRNCNLQRRLEKDVIFGSANIKKFKVIEDGTLIILDESHYAQGVSHTMAGFLERQQLEYPNLEANDRDASLLCISATPFTQLSAMTLDSIGASGGQYNGEIPGAVNLKPGPGYFGVEDMDRAGLIRYFNKDNLLPLYEDQLASNQECKYAVVRCINEEILIQMKRLAADAGYAIETFDQISDFELAQFKKRPPRKTIVFVKHYLRLGMYLPKQFIFFAMETSFDPKIDSTVQSSLGRMLGYDNPGNIPVFISENLREEVQTFIKLTAGESVDPLSICIGTGMKSVKPLKRKRTEKEINNIIPIEIMPWNDEYTKETSQKSREAKRHCLRTAVLTNTWINFNNSAQSDEIRAIVLENEHFTYTNLACKTAMDERTFERLVEHVDKRMVMKPGTSVGFHDHEVRVYVHPGKRRVFILCQTNEAPDVDIYDRIPRSTGKDIFNAKINKRN